MLGSGPDPTDQPVTDIQPLFRVSGSASYASFKADEKAWRRQGSAFTTSGWPATIEEGTCAVVMLPLPAGRVGLAAGRHPRPVATPHFSSGRSIEPGRYDDMVLAILARWIPAANNERRVRLAPPVVELVQRGSVVERRVVDFGLRWHLPAADSV
jgi:hypothetical protein